MGFLALLLHVLLLLHHLLAPVPEWVASRTASSEPSVRPSVMRVGSIAAVGQSRTAAGHPAWLSSRDTSLFAAVVEHLDSIIKDPIRVSPQGLESQPSVFIRLAQASEDLVEERRRILQQLDVLVLQESDRCRVKGGLPPRDVDSEEWKKSFENHFVCVFIGFPRMGGAFFPPTGVDEREEGRVRGLWSVRVITVGDGPAQRILDVTAQPLPQGQGWKIIEARELTAVWS